MNLILALHLQFALRSQELVAGQPVPQLHPRARQPYLRRSTWKVPIPCEYPFKNLDASVFSSVILRSPNGSPNRNISKVYASHKLDQTSLSTFPICRWFNPFLPAHLREHTDTLKLKLIAAPASRSAKDKIVWSKAPAKRTGLGLIQVCCRETYEVFWGGIPVMLRQLHLFHEMEESSVNKFCTHKCTLWGAGDKKHDTPLQDVPTW